MNVPTEDDIVRLLQQPDTRRRGFEVLVNTFGQKLYWQIRRMVTYHDDADDVLQNTFMKVWANLDSFRGEAKLSTWLFKIAYNESITFLKRQHNTVSLDTSPVDEDDEGTMSLANTLESDPYFDGDETEAMLQAAIATLPAKQKAVFNMKYYDDMKYEEMSHVTGTSVGALKASYHLAVKKIEDFFHQHE